jgi:hypothetical protein
MTGKTLRRILEIPFSAKFLGRLLASKPSREPQLQQFCAKCEQSLNILEVLYGRSWDGNQMVMLDFNIPRSALSWIVEASFRPAMRPKLLILDSVHNTRICLPH